MSSDAGAHAAPLTAAGRILPQDPGGATVRRDDLGAFRATLGAGPDLVVLRTADAGLLVGRRDVRESVPWGSVVGLTLTYADAGLARVPVVRVLLESGPSLDLADGLAPGAADLPESLAAGAGPLLRVERCRLLAAVVAACAGLAPRTPDEFRRGPRGVAVPALAAGPRLLPRGAAPLLLAASVAAIVFAFGVRWGTAVALMAVVATHELGHALAMRLVGVEVGEVVFVPLLGAGTRPGHAFTSRWDEARVMLGGPVSGVPVAAAIALLLAAGPVAGPLRGALGIALLAALAVNIFNVLPLRPLDGGHLLGHLTESLPPAARALVAFTPIAVGVVVVFTMVGDDVMLVALVFLGLSVALTRVALRRERHRAWMRALPAPAAAVRASLRDVTFAFGGLAREDADGGVPPDLLSPGQARAVAALYVAEVAALCASAWLFVRWCPWILDYVAGRE